MKNLRHTLAQITQLTSEIESKYPELYQFLEEDPITLPIEAHPEVNKKALQSYLESLQQLLKHHLQTHKNIIT